MRIYLNGKIVPVPDVTWDQLGSPSCYVDWEQDTHIDKFPAHIRLKRRGLFAEVQDSLTGKPLFSQICNYFKATFFQGCAKQNNIVLLKSRASRTCRDERKD